MERWRLGLALAGVLTIWILAGVAIADAPSVIKVRVGHFKDIGRAAHAIQLEVAKPAADPAVIADSARKIEGLADQIPSWFPAGSGPETGAATQARAEIWADPTGFQAKAAALRASAEALEGVAASGDQAAIKAGFINLAKACQGCHSAYRSGD